MLAQSVAADRYALSGTSGKELRAFSPAQYVQVINFLSQGSAHAGRGGLQRSVPLADLIAAPVDPAPVDPALDTVVTSSEVLDLTAAVAANDEEETPVL